MCFFWHSIHSLRDGGRLLKIEIGMWKIPIRKRRKYEWKKKHLNEFTYLSEALSAGVEVSKKIKMLKKKTVCSPFASRKLWKYDGLRETISAVQFQFYSFFAAFDSCRCCVRALQPAYTHTHTLKRHRNDIKCAVHWPTCRRSEKLCFTIMYSRVGLMHHYFIRKPKYDVHFTTFDIVVSCEWHISHRDWHNS